MRVFFDPDFDSGAWPGPLASRGAAAGEAWVGPLGLLGLLETAYGLRGPSLPEAERVGHVARAAQAQDGFWSASAAVDPLAVARRLLQWRDLLLLHGWAGQPVSPRLTALAEVTQGAPVGTVDRLLAAITAAEARGGSLSALTSFATAETLNPAMARLFMALERHGTQVTYAQPEKAHRAPSDLARAGVQGQSLTGDGSLQLLRPHGVLEAAEALAAALAAADSLTGTVIIGSDAVLDGALRRHGLPTTGGAGHVRDNAVLEVLPLVLRLAFSPPDPQRALELLTLPYSPVPRGVGYRLSRALHETPAVDSDTWRAALVRGLEKYEDEESRSDVEARLAILFSPSRGARVPIADIRERSRCIGAWLRGRLATATSEADLAAFGAAVGQHSAFETYLDLSGAAELGEAAVGRLLEEATRATGGAAPYPPEAGLVTVGAPGAIAGPARRIVWWNFQLDAARRVAPWPFSAAEVTALASIGVQLPPREAVAVGHALRWRRPLEAATEALVLVCPERADDGEARHPHPLLDEVLAAVPAAERTLAHSALLRTEVGLPVAPTRVQRDAKPVVSALHSWRLDPNAIALRPVESPSSAEKLLGCSLSWVLGYVGKVRGGMTAQLPQNEQLLGTFAHALIERVLAERPDASPEEAEAHAAELFTTEGPRLAAALFRPGQDKQREDARVATRASTRALYQMLRDGHFSVASIEEPIRKAALGSELEGKPDVMLADKDGQPIVVDLKWGRSKRADSLKNGTATQLAAYSALKREDGKRFPPAAFFIIRAQQVLTSDVGVFPGVPVIEGPPLEDTWKALERAHADAHARLQAGTATAPGITADGERVEKFTEDLEEDGTLTLSPPCHYCELSALCGREFARAPINEEEIR